ncbi:hypothetical protein [Actinomyces sp. 594]|uniref:hypothetical protein n=1 Tax=Actinomyces sp. 594 TaxID=2057793 RepID=UPI00214C4665|nr:hypothetical protein [Actinomyces sp. 594]
MSEEAVVDSRTSAAELPGARVVNARLRVGGFTTAGGAVTLAQCDGTTCGATAVLAARLLLGGPSAGVQTPVPGTARPGRVLQETLAASQRSLQRAMNRHAGGPLGPLPWTSRLGSTPWSVAAELTRVLRRVRPDIEACTVTWVDDRGAGWGAVVAGTRELLAVGVPVILLTGGPPVRHADGAGGARRLLNLNRIINAIPAVPRHYVLALPWKAIGRQDPGPGHAHLYDPSSGVVRALDLLAPRAQRGPGPRELGYWPRVLAVIAPPPPRALQPA